MGDPAGAIQILQTAGVLGGLVLLLVLLMARKLVFGWQYDAKVQESDEWKRMFLEVKDIARKSINTAEAALPVEDRLVRIEQSLELIARGSGGG